MRGAPQVEGGPECLQHLIYWVQNPKPGYVCLCVFMFFSHLTLLSFNQPPLCNYCRKSKAGCGKQTVVYSCGNNHEETWAVPSVIG